MVGARPGTAGGLRQRVATLVDAAYTDDLHEPAEIGAAGEGVSDATFKAMAIISADPDTHARKLKLLREMGASAVVVMNVAGGDPDALFRAYGERVLPALRGD